MRNTDSVLMMSVSVSFAFLPKVPHLAAELKRKRLESFVNGTRLFISYISLKLTHLLQQSCNKSSVFADPLPLNEDSLQEFS